MKQCNQAKLPIFENRIEIIIKDLIWPNMAIFCNLYHQLI